MLAAGASTRMGQSKQLLKIGDTPLLAYTTQQALATSPNVLVVLGANAEEHEKVLKPLGVRSSVHSSWQKGIGSSIKTGVRDMLAWCPHLDGILIMVCDQPHVTSDHLRVLIKTFNENHGSIVASQYMGTKGVPAIFSNEHFYDLLGLDDNSGAKVVITRYPNEVITIDFPEGAEDLDTPEDYDRFITSQQHGKLDRQ